MRKNLKFGIVLIFIFVLAGCTNTQQPTREKTSAEKTAFLIDTVMATALYNNSNFSAGKDYVNTKSRTNSNTTTNTTFSNGGTQSQTVTKSTTKTKSKGFGFGIGF